VCQEGVSSVFVTCEQLFEVKPVFCVRWKRVSRCLMSKAQFKCWFKKSQSYSFHWDLWSLEQTRTSLRRVPVSTHQRKNKKLYLFIYYIGWNIWENVLPGVWIYFTTSRTCLLLNSPWSKLVPIRQGKRLIIQIDDLWTFNFILNLTFSPRHL